MDTARGLSWRDGAATVLTGFAVLLTAAVTNGWGWPVVGGSYRIGALALFLVGLAGCIVGGQSFVGARSDAFLAIGKWSSILAPVLLLATLIVGTAPFFVGLASLIVALWLLATVHHAVNGFHGARNRTAAT